MKHKKGLLVSFEGMEGAGKTTQCTILEKKLQQLGRKTLVVREPGGVPISEEIRDVVLSPRNKGIAVTTEVLLFQAARAQLYHEIVLPSLSKGVIVLMDRTRDSSTIYQGMVRKIGVEWIEQLNDYSTQNTVPDLTFLLDLPADIGFERRKKAEALDRIEQEGVELQIEVCKAYLQVARKNDHKRWVVINGEMSVDDVADAVWKAVEKKLGES